MIKFKQIFKSSKKEEVKENLYIRILRFGDIKFNGFTENELINGLNLIGSWEENLIKKMAKDAVDSGRQSFSGAGGTHYVPILDTPLYFTGDKNENGEPKYVLRIEAYFNYIDYLELIAVKKSSRIATAFSIIALLAVVITTIISIKIPIELNEKQFNKIIEPRIEIKGDQFDIMINKPLEIKKDQFDHIIKEINSLNNALKTNN